MRAQYQLHLRMAVHLAFLSLRGWLVYYLPGKKEELPTLTCIATMLLDVSYPLCLAFSGIWELFLWS